MIMKKNILTVIIFLFTSVMLFSFGGKEKETPQETPLPPPVIVQITGVVRLTGPALFTELIISDNEEQVWYIVKEEYEKLRDLQQSIVTVEAEETVTELQFANGMPAGIRRELRNIRIISVK